MTTLRRQAEELSERRDEPSELKSTDVINGRSRDISSTSRKGKRSPLGILNPWSATAATARGDNGPLRNRPTSSLTSSMDLDGNVELDRSPSLAVELDRFLIAPDGDDDFAKCASSANADNTYGFVVGLDALLSSTCSVASTTYGRSFPLSPAPSPSLTCSRGILR